MKTTALCFMLLHTLFFCSAQEITNFRDPATKLYGFKDKAGKVLVEPAYNAVGYASEGMVAVKQDDKWGYINTTGKLVIPLQFEQANAFSDGMAPVGKNIAAQGYGTKTSWGYIDKTGQLKIDYRFDFTSSFKNGYAIIGADVNSLESVFGLIDKTGKEIIPVKYTALEEMSEGLLLAATGSVRNYTGKYGFIDINGKEVVPFIYEGGMGFHEGLACVQKNGKSGFINKSGQVVIPFLYDGLSYFEKGRAEVYKDGKAIFINKKGVKVGS